MRGGPGAFWTGEEERQEVMDVMQSGHLYEECEADVTARINAA